MCTLDISENEFKVQKHTNLELDRTLAKANQITGFTIGSIGRLFLCMMMHPNNPCMCHLCFMLYDDVMMLYADVMMLYDNVMMIWCCDEIYDDVRCWHDVDMIWWPDGGDSW